jgi:hypothetical protein
LAIISDGATLFHVFDQALYWIHAERANNSGNKKFRRYLL